MRTIRCPRFLLRLFILNFITTCTRAQSEHLSPEFILRGVTLSVKPANELERGSELKLICTANVSYFGSNSPLLRFSFFKEFNKLNSVYILQTNTSNQVEYNVTKARASHTGRYQCDVTAKDQYRDSSPQMITVKGIQTPELIVDKHAVTQGDEVSITCSAKEESGVLTFVIRDGSNIIYQEASYTAKMQKNHSLKSPGLSKLSCSYFINLGSDILYSNVSNVVSVVVNELDLTPTITVLPSTEVIEGDTVNIICDVEGNYQSSPRLTLSKGSRLFQISDRKKEYKAVVTAADSGRYECSVMVNNVEKTANANLTVKELFSKPVLTLTPSEVFERQQFTVTCTSSDFASERIGSHDVKYTIYRYNQALSSTDGTYRDTASTETNGNYTCTAQVNDTIKWSHLMIFTAKVLVSRPNITVLHDVILGQLFQIECYSDSGSFPITYTLKRNHSRLSIITVSRPSQKAIFNISIRFEKEINEFTCEAQNNGNDSVQMSGALSAQVIVPVEKPNLMTIPEADNVVEAEEVKFVCSVRKGSLPITFKWYHDDNHRPVHTVTEKKDHATYSLPSASSMHSGTYYCEALNQGVEKVEKSNHIVVTVRMANWKKGLIIGVCLLVVTGLVLAFLLRHRAKRGKVSVSDGVGIWSKRPPAVDSSEVVDLDEHEELNVEYTEVLHPQTADPTQVL
ncbi:platelet endothelial cell adhesion molecule isoform X3 [Neoarius graeffei]|uniref:platelet endothelial cell adhesion molecule isoform X3 n=1 Tax=Neoarius graeffei TaxID=443677 RepID=UPI00298BCD47|nr:platelet endothelial cell adhesion molecule isoform X3 [Neoarius graeffei]